MIGQRKITRYKQIDAFDTRISFMIPIYDIVKTWLT